ncbi:unnamed protein product, partial [Meganyctiphanes norvegica]
VPEQRKMDPRYWDRIPDEILENILIDVPTYQIPLNEAWICKRWTRIILHSQFWVHKLKNHDISIDDKIWSVLQEFSNTERVSCLYYTSLYQEHHINQTPCLYYKEVDEEHEYPVKAAISNLDYVLSIPFDEDGGHNKRWVISDSSDTMLMASGVLICRSHWFVYVALKSEKIKALSLLLKLLEAREIPVCVRDDHAFWNCSPRMNYLEHLKGGSDEAKALIDFRGCLPTLEGIPSSINNIHLSIGVDDQNNTIDPGLSRLNQNTKITLHLKAGTNISSLAKIYSDTCICFIVSGLKESHILWMTEVTKKFLTTGKLMLIFFDYQLDLKSSEHMLKSIAEAGFDLEFEILCASPTLSSESEKILSDLGFELWPDCGGSFQWFDCDTSLFYHLWNQYGSDFRVQEGDYIDYESGVWLDLYRY